ncbi:MAG: hypothetical protein IPJ74_11100 [Saprospiraceae bacterium]|nr:hypothetical protein [Saprospiraceae bacterium]
MLWLEQNAYEKALPYLQQDLQLTEELAIANPHSFTLQNNLCYSWRDVGKVLAALDRKEEALALYEKAAAGWQALWEQTELPEIKKRFGWGTRTHRRAYGNKLNNHRITHESRRDVIMIAYS